MYTIFMRIVTWNVNGIRSIFDKGFKNWLSGTNPDIVCIQETKSNHEELHKDFKEINGYYSYFNSSKLKKGHSGVAIYTKFKPLKVETNLGIERFDEEGRCLKLTFDDFILYNFYIPNGSRDKTDIPYKLNVYKELLRILKKEVAKEVILAGDFNIAYNEID